MAEDVTLAVWGDRERATHARAALAAAVVGVAAAAIWLGWWSYGGAPRPAERGFLAVSALAFALALAAGWPHLRDRRERAGALAAITASLGFPALAVLAQAAGYSHNLRPGEQASAIFAGWGAFFAIMTLRGARVELGPVPRVPTRAAVLALAAVVFVSLATLHLDLWGRRELILDEVLYLIQSNLFSEPGFARRIDPELAPFFNVSLARITDGRFYTQYPPGWPAILAVFQLAGLRPWAGTILGTGAVVATYHLARRLYSPSAGLLAAVLFGTSLWFLDHGGNYMSHAASVTMSVLAAWWLLRAADARGGVRARRYVLAGFALGVLVSIRPLTGVAVGASLLLWRATSGEGTPREVAAMAVWLAAGGILPLAGTLYFNAVTNGHPLLFGYEATNGHLVSLGFGQRGIVAFDDAGRPYAIAPHFGPVRAVAHLAWRLGDAVAGLLPAALLLPVLLFAFIERVRVRWRAVACFAVAPVAYFFFYHTDNRYYLELLPFAFAGIAAVVLRASERDAAPGRALLVMLVAAAMLRAGAHVAERARTRGDRLPSAEVAALQRQHGKVLVFVRAPHEEHGLFEELYRFNVDHFPGPVVVARDLGDANARLTARFPGHVPVRIEAAPGGAVPAAVLLQRPPAPGAPAAGPGAR